MRRSLPLLLVVASVVSGAGCDDIGPTTRSSGTTADLSGTTGEPTGSTGEIDWSSPIELPPPRRGDFRSEFVSEEEGYRFWPRSSPADPGVAYRFDTGHCGLTFMTDLDGSFWLPANPGDPDASDFFHNQEVGAIVVAEANLALYRSADGTIVELERLPGPIVTGLCE